MSPQDAADTILTLLSWCEDNHIFIDSRLAIVRDEATNGIAVRNATDAPIESPPTLVKIPKRAILSARTVSFSEHIPHVPYGHGAHLGLSLALYGEFLRGLESRWSGYLQSLPQSAVDIALLWADDQLPQGLDQGRKEDLNIEDVRHARAWAAGTELSRELRGDGVDGVLEEVRQYYASVAAPILSSLMPCASISISGFLHAYSLVSSRAFLVDAFHGLSMVPIADAFNHTQDNHVHLESDYDVCVTCGSFAPCPHDQDDASPDADALSRRPGTAFISASYAGSDCGLFTEPDAYVGRRAGVCVKADSIIAIGADTASGAGDSSDKCGRIAIAGVTDVETEDTCDMVLNQPIPPYSEAFNTYGEHLTNAQLLARYGFVLEGNENDTVSFELDDIHAAWSSLGGVARSPAQDDAGWDEFVNLARRVVQTWPRYDRWRESNLVYHPYQDATLLGQGAISTFHGLDEGVNTASFNDDYRDRKGGRTTPTPLFIGVNSDAKISHALWVCLALLASASVSIPGPLSSNVQANVAALVRLAERQLFWETLSGSNDSEDMETEADDDGGSSRGLQTTFSPAHSDDDKVLAALAGAVSWACTMSPRAKRLGARRPSPADGGSTLATEELGNLLDALPPDMRRTRLALSLVLGERSILESCRCGWDDIRALLSG